MASQRLILEAVKTEEAEHQEGSRDGEVRRGGAGGERGGGFVLCHQSQDDRI